jgi:hypothetical protein
MESNDYDELVAEIKHRTLTPGALARKVQATIAKDLKTAKQKEQSNNHGDSSDAFSVSSSQLVQDKKDKERKEDNRYMPKVSLLRPDGSSLTDIYSSKREDMWAKIMKAQLAEEVISYSYSQLVASCNDCRCCMQEERKRRERKEKLRAHEEFGVLLKQQVDEYRERHKSNLDDDKIYANTEPATVRSDGLYYFLQILSCDLLCHLYNTTDEENG